MACKYIPEKQWNWKNGEEWAPMSAYDYIQFNYFSCGTYYFDGVFQIVEFPKGVQIYHGSESLAKSQSEFPVGLPFYKPFDYTNDASNVSVPARFDSIVTANDMPIETNMARYFTIQNGWFADPDTARLYSRLDKPDDRGEKVCGDRCVFAYEFTEPVKFLLLDHNYNIVKFLSDERVPDNIKSYLSHMVGDIGLSNVGESKSVYNEFVIDGKRRISNFFEDGEFARWLSSTDGFTDRYAGYAANTQHNGDGSTFHLEFMICNPLKSLRRNLSNSIDWHFNGFNPSKIPPAFSEFMTQLSYYKTTNVDFHAGNLLEHSIWTLLYAEKLVFSELRYDIDRTTKLETIAVAFLHDIGKMVVDHMNVTVRKNDVVYNSIPDHPTIGYGYIMGYKRLPILSPAMKTIGYFNIDGLLDALKLRKESIATYADIVAMHWSLGDYVRDIPDTADSNRIRSVAREYINQCGKDRSFRFFYMLTTVSIADILASQPFGMDNLTSEMNHTSLAFPFVANVPKKYRGGNVADKTASIRRRLTDEILRQANAMEIDRDETEMEIIYL